MKKTSSWKIYSLKAFKPLTIANLLNDRLGCSFKCEVLAFQTSPARHTDELFSETLGVHHQRLADDPWRFGNGRVGARPQPLPKTSRCPLNRHFKPLTERAGDQWAVL